MLLAQVAAVAAAPRTSLFRLVKTLSRMNYLRYYDRSKTYCLGTRVLSLGFSVLQRMELRELARPYPEALSSKLIKAVNLAFLDKHEMVYRLERVRLPGYRHVNVDIGSRSPAWRTAVALWGELFWSTTNLTGLKR
jgi:DNA-binding IclR family transcriptional regulator